MSCPVPSIRSSIIPLLGPPRGLFPNILPSNISLSSPSPLVLSTSFHKIIYHSSSWPAPRPLLQHSSLQPIPQQSIPSKHMSYPVPSIRSSIIPLLGPPRSLFPNILPSNTSLSSPSPLSTCPIQFFFLW